MNTEKSVNALPLVQKPYNVFTFVSTEAAAFIEAEITQALRMVTPATPSDAGSAVSQTEQRFLRWICGWVESFRHYRFGDMKLHQLLYMEARQDPRIWDFLFGRVMTFALMIDCQINNDKTKDSLDKIVGAYYNGSKTTAFQPMVSGEKSTVGSDQGLLLSESECELMRVSSDYITKLYQNQPWVLIFLFIIECAQQHNVIGKTIGDPQKTLGLPAAV